MTSQGPAHADLTLPGDSGAPSFLLVLTHGAGGTISAPDLLAVRDAALRLGGAVALITQPYRVRGARAPGSAARQDQAWQEIIASLRAGTWLAPGGSVPNAADRSRKGKRLAPGGSVPPAAGDRAGGVRLALGQSIPLVVGGRSNGARVACRTAVAVGATGVIALAFPLRLTVRAARAATSAPRAATSAPRAATTAARAGTIAAPTRDEELRSAASHAVQVLVVTGDKDPFGIPDPGDAIRVVVLKGESHALSRNPAAVADAVTGWLSGVVPPVH